MNKELKRLLRKLEKQGWPVSYKGKHIKVKSPVTNKKIVISRTPSDHRTMKNMLSRLKKEGYEDGF